jgi:hypothetical protein
MRHGGLAGARLSGRGAGAFGAGPAPERIGAEGGAENVVRGEPVRAIAFPQAVAGLPDTIPLN